MTMTWGICRKVSSIAGVVCVGLSTGLWAQGATDALYQSKGDHERTYKFEAASAVSPYRIYVPDAWDGRKKLPLVVILHGSNLNHDAAFDREPTDLKGVLKREADRHGFIVVAPEGFDGGSYGSTYPLPLTQYLHPGAGAPRGPRRPDRPAGEELTPGTPMPGGPPPPAGARPVAGAAPPPRTDATAPELNGPRLVAQPVSPEERERRNKLSEQDVLNVIRIVQKEYNTDPSRLYLMGNSMGSIGSYSLAAAYPTMFTALAPSDGPVDPVFYPYEKAKELGGILIVHGEDDGVAPIDDSEVMAYLFRKQGIETVFDPVAKGGHGNSWYMELPKIFNFFESHPSRHVAHK